MKKRNRCRLSTVCACSQRSDVRRGVAPAQHRLRRRDRHDNVRQGKNNNSNFILIPDASSADAVCYILSIFGNTLKQQKLYSDLIYMLLSDEDLASIFCTFAKETDCQMLAIDITGKVLAYSKPFRVTILTGCTVWRWAISTNTSSSISSPIVLSTT